MLPHLTADVRRKTITEQKKDPATAKHFNTYGLENRVLSDIYLKPKIGFSSVQQSVNQKTKQKKYRIESRVANTYSSNPDPDPAFAKRFGSGSGSKAS